MIRNFTFFCLFVLLTLGNYNTYAQKWYDISENGRRERQQAKEEKREQKRERTTTNTHYNLGSKDKAPESASNTKAAHTLPKSQMKPKYRIDFLANFYLKDLVKEGSLTYTDKIPDYAASAISMYQGLLLAADTIKQYGYRLDIYVHDLTDKSPEKLIQSKALDSSDLIIGAVQWAQVGTIAAFAKQKKINFISTLSPADASITDNPFFTLLQPTLETHCRWISAAMLKKNKGKTITLLYRNSNEVDKSAYTYFTQNDTSAFQMLNCNTFPLSAATRGLFSPDEINVVAIPVIETGLADSLMRFISKLYPKYQFEVYGMPSWKGMTALKYPNAFPNCAVNITYPFFIEYNTAAGIEISERCMSRYGNRANELVYRGYEVLYWYAYLLVKYGTYFNAHFADNGMAPFTQFEIKEKRDSRNNFLYNENQHLYMYRYQAGSYMLTE